MKGDESMRYLRRRHIHRRILQIQYIQRRKDHLMQYCSEEGNLNVSPISSIFLYPMISTSS
ncbi:hypothetical protein HAX54_050577, partial [Datura stramonium]|nr:hypothetical protein [Datura stramonium]